MITRTLTAIAFALAIACSGCSQTRTPPATASCPALEIAEVVAPDAPGVRQVHTPDGGTLTIAHQSLMNTADVIDARPATAEGHNVLEIDLSPTPAAALRAFSATHVGARLAFMVNGSVRNVARILDPIRGQGLIIDPVDPSEVSALAQCVHAQQHGS